MAGSTSMLEPDLAPHYEAWKKKPGPEGNAMILKALDPVIDGAIKTHVGAPNPLIKSRARLMTLQGLAGYDPARGRLQTHLYNHLQGLKRVNRQQTTVLRVPERVSLDRYNLKNYTDELSNELGREPTDNEIADRTGFSVRRLAKVRSYNPALAEGTIDEASGGVYGGVTQPGSLPRDFHHQLVYDELDAHHRKVMEFALGMNGHKQLGNMAIARRLKRSPGAISQAKLRIQRKLDEAEGLAEGL
jgi:hypothetical protein